jgi:hypothetical protein
LHESRTDVCALAVARERPDEPFKSILLNEDLRKYKTDRNANLQLEFSFMKHFKK